MAFAQRIYKLLNVLNCITVFFGRWYSISSSSGYIAFAILFIVVSLLVVIEERFHSAKISEKVSDVEIAMLNLTREIQEFQIQSAALTTELQTYKLIMDARSSTSAMLEAQTSALAEELRLYKLMANSHSSEPTFLSKRRRLDITANSLDSSGISSATTGE